MKYANWKVPAEAPFVPHPLLEAGATPLLAALLSLRGITDRTAAREFLRGGKETMSSPFDLTDMDFAVLRLSQAIARGEHVAVYGDYDVDGITSTFLLWDYLRSCGLSDCEWYIPDRLSDGYGLNKDAIDHLKAIGVKLIVTVDCGVTNLEECEYAASLGLDTIITDHHECHRDENGCEMLPNAHAIVDPKRRPKPNSEDSDCCRSEGSSSAAGAFLAGVGVAFKLVCAMDGDSEKMLSRYGDLVAAGTVADVMTLQGENRYMVGQGLKQIEEGNCRPGLTALLIETGFFDPAGRKLKPVSSSTIGYTLAPRINAAGRLGKVECAFRLLQAEDLREAARPAAELCELNRERQQRELEVWNEVQDMLPAHDTTAPLVLESKSWGTKQSGIIGIVASRLSDMYSVPAIMICSGEGIPNRYKGSCRSSGGFNLYEALSDCSDCLVSFGGHAMAAGISVKPDKVDELRRRLAEYYRDHPDKTVPALDIDLRVEDPEMLSMECVESLDLLEPCGNGNPRPVLFLGGAVLDQLTPIGGREKKHLKLRLRKLFDAEEAEYDCVFFSQTESGLGLRPGQLVDAVFSPQINEFRGRRSVQLVITDMRAHTED